MPFYEYVCNSCGLSFEKMKGMSRSDESEACPECKAPDAKKQVTAANFAFVFPASQTKGMAPPNTGTSHDWNYDAVIGRAAEEGHKVIQERQTYKQGVLKQNPGSTGKDLSRTHDGDYRVMKPEERKASELGRATHRKAMTAIEATKKIPTQKGQA